MTKPSWQDFATHDESIVPELWDGVVGAWCPSLGPTGSRLHDMSRRSNWGTLTNMDPPTDWVVDGGQYALDFDGSDDFVDTGIRGLLYGLPSMTCSFWGFVRSDSQQRFLSNWDNSRGFIVMSESGGNLTFYLSNPTTLRTVNTSAYVTAMSHICAMYDGSKMEVWINGVLRGSLAGLSGVTGTSTVPLDIGRATGGNQPLNGRIDDIKIRNRAMTPNEIVMEYQLGRGGMYQRRRRRAIYLPQAGFQAAWALRRSQIIGGGLR